MGVEDRKKDKKDKDDNKDAKMISIAFDCDGTLIHESDQEAKHPRAREKYRTMLIDLARCKNVLIHVWSAAGEQHARDTVQALALMDYVDSYSAKQVKTNKKGDLVITADFKPDICFDNIELDLAKINVLVEPSEG